MTCVLASAKILATRKYESRTLAATNERDGVFQKSIASINRSESLYKLRRYVQSTPAAPPAALPAAAPSFSFPEVLRPLECMSQRL